jgi:hypothetical protein
MPPVPLPTDYPQALEDEFTIVVDGNESVIVYGMCVGDFNASFIPGSAKAASNTLSLVYNETRQADAATEVTLPVRMMNSEIVGAVSLILDIPTEHMTVTGVTMGGNNGQLDWAVNGDELRIGWTAGDPVWFFENETLLNITMMTSETFSEGDEIRITLAADPLNELADGTAKVIPDAVIGIDAIVFSTYGITDPSIMSALTLESNPNPFAVYTVLSYNLPVDGHVTLKVSDMLGRQVSKVVDEYQVGGKYTYKMDALPLQPGMYNVTITVHSNSGDLIKTIRIVQNW